MTLIKLGVSRENGNEIMKAHYNALKQYDPDIKTFTYETMRKSVSDIESYCVDYKQSIPKEKKGDKDQVFVRIRDIRLHTEILLSKICKPPKFETQFDSQGNRVYSTSWNSDDLISCREALRNAEINEENVVLIPIEIHEDAIRSLYKCDPNKPLVPYCY